MFEQIINAIIKALSGMVSKSSDLISDFNISSVSRTMKKSIDLWHDMYCDRPPWENLREGVVSTGIPKQICDVFKTIMLSEFKLNIVDEEGKPAEELEEDSFIHWFDKCINNHLIDNLGDKLEHGLATGGLVIKPYIDGDNIYFDFVTQGDFYPISFDDDGNITDIAFVDQFINGKNLYTKVERQTFTGSTIEITNKAFKSKLHEDRDRDKSFELGNEIPLESIEKWKDIAEAGIIENVSQPLFGHYKVASANNVDTKSPLGISIFAPARNLIIKADQQFSRLDWEYEGGQMAIDVDPTAIEHNRVEDTSYWGTPITSSIAETNQELGIAQGRRRLYRGTDLGTDETYKVFAPGLRDNNYLAGFDKYLNMIEDRVGMARGSLSSLESQARTATEITVLHQRAYETASANQTNLQKCLEDVIYAAWVLCTNYASELGVSQVDDYDCVIDWGDSVLIDKEAELEKKIVLCDKGILSKAEVRAAYTGEELALAEQKIKEIEDSSRSQMLDDIFTGAINGNKEGDNNNEELNQEDENNDDSEDDESPNSNNTKEEERNKEEQEE